MELLQATNDPTFLLGYNYFVFKYSEVQYTDNLKGVHVMKLWSLREWVVEDSLVNKILTVEVCMLVVWSQAKLRGALILRHYRMLVGRSLQARDGTPSRGIGGRFPRCSDIATGTPAVRSQGRENFLPTLRSSVCRRVGMIFQKWPDTTNFPFAV